MSWDPVWEKVFQEQEWGKYPAESLIRFIARNYYQKVRKDVKILELGCGPGANIWYMAREGFDVYGIDGSITAIEKAKQRIKGEGLEAHLQVGDILKLPYEDNYFDCAVDNECLYATPLKDAETILKEASRVLKKGALFYSRTFAHDTYVGHSRARSDSFEYEHVFDGPLANKGFVRLIDSNGIGKLYGNIFEIVSTDRLEYTHGDEAIKIVEWIIFCRNEK